MRKFLTLFAVLVLSCVLAFAQTKVVTGKVTDQQGQPVPFASIRVKGTKQGVSADADGNYTIKVKPGDVLMVSGTGLTQKEISVGEGTALNIEVSRQTSNLTEVVVTSLGVQRQSKELGYSTAKINNKELNQAKVVDVSTGLQGKVSGLQVNLTNNGVDPATRVVLRGNRSITGNNQALIVLDGFPIDDISYINKINPEDIESVNVLKGAVAAAIYGSKASNGVLVIATKRGTRGKPTITVSNTTNWETVSYLPSLQNKFGPYGGEGAYTNPDGTVEYVPYENQSYGPVFDGSTQPRAISPVFKPDGVTVDHFDTIYTKATALPDEKKKFFNTGITNQFDVSYSSGDERGTFYLGFQDAHIYGVTPKDESRRDNFRVGGSRTYGKFTADYTASYNQRSDNVVGLSYNQTSGGVFSGRPIYFELINAPSNADITNYKDWAHNVYASPDGYFNAYATNPYWTIDNSRRKKTTYDLFGTVNLAFHFTPWFTLSDRVGIVQTTQQFNYYRAGITFAPWAIADPWSAGNVPSSLKSLKPSTFDETFQEQRLNNDLIGSFDKSFGSFTVKGLVGWNYAQRYQRTMFLQGDNLQFPGFYNISSVLGVPGYGESSYQQRETAVYEEVSVGFKDFLFLHVSNRDEWNSVLDPNNQHYNYPGIDLSFVFTQAFDGFKNSKFLTYGKVRGGYTKVANINLGTAPYGAYSLINPFNPAGGFPFNNLGGYSQSTTYLNPQIQPERTTASEVGIDLGFLNNKINFSAAYYKSITKGQTLTAQLSAAAGFTNKVVNAGQVTNKGLELDINVTVIKNRDWTWTVGANYAHYNNVVDELLPGVDELQLSGLNGGVSGGIYAIKGHPYPVIKTTDWLRDSATGKVIVDATSGRPSIDANTKIYGNTNPTDILGIKTSLTWKNLTFGAVLDYRGGNQIINTIGTQLDFTGISAHSAENGRQRFIFPNSVVSQNGKYVDNTSVAVDNGGNISGAGFWPDVYTSGIGSVYVTSAAFWKLRELSLTYEVPASAVAKTKVIRRAVIGFVGRNLIMLRPKSNLWTDPEFSDTNGNDVGRTSEFQLPPTRMYGVNLTLTF
jgi:TonB-linked SusC/RagA family outer membrane protein